MPLKAAILSIGDELILGQTVDTNAAWLSARLAQLGFAITEHITLSDSQADIADNILRISKDVDIIIATGGLGPTDDDLTRHAVAQVLNVNLELHQPTLDQMAEFFNRIQRPMAQRNRIQAMIPKGCEIIENPVGTACGIMAKINKAQAFFIPGVPREMRHLYENSILPQLKKLAQHTGDMQTTITHILHCFGAGESTVAEMLGDMMTRHRNPIVNSTVARGIISIRVNSTAVDEAIARKLIEPVEVELRQRLGNIVFGCDDETLAAVVAGQLIRKKATLATAESCTGGLLAKTITDIPGASDVFRAGWVTYSNQAKSEMLNVEPKIIETHGAVSQQVAAQMAANARKLAKTDFALSITGIAGPSGSTPDKPIGLVFIGLASDTAVEVARNVFHGDRPMVRLRAVNTALDMLRQRLGS